MALTNELVSQFAKITKQNAQTKSESIVYGTVVEYGESKYVQLDGSNVLTPYTSTTNVAAGERVTVMIKNHTATVTGNKTSPAVRNSELTEIGDKISDFEIVVADKVDTLQLVAVEARIKDLEADNIVVNDTLIANKAQIDNLEVNKLSAKDAEIQYANIDFANIGKAAMEYFYAKSGLIDNVVVGDQTITGNLVGVTINGDRIEGNTVIADKLVIKGDDGLYYKLNTDGMSIEAQQTEYNSLNGSIIQAKSITATKIDVKDLVAFDATIGGFEINDHAIHSITKTSADNTTRGIYMDNDGQFVVGDASNFMKYYKTSDGSYKLEISLIDTMQSAINSMQTQISAVPGQITAAVSGVRVGGTNLLRKSSVGITNANYEMQSFYLTETLKNGDEVTVRIWGALGSDRSKFMVYNSGGMQELCIPIWDGSSYTGTFTWKEFGDNNRITIWQAPSSGSSSSTIDQIKLERGNKGTDWSPSPSDMEQDISDLRAEVNLTPDRISAAVGDIQIGGTNLIRDTGWYTECAPGWATEGNAVLKYPYDLYPGQDDFFTEGYIFFGTTDVASGIWVPRIPVKAGETYTLSFRMRGTYLNAIWAGFDANDALVWSEIRRYEEYLTTDISYTMTIPTGVTSIHIVFRSTAGYASVLGRIKLERGNKATSWSPHPLDNARGVVNGSALNITKDAVQIETPVFSVNVSGTNGDMSLSESGLAINQVNSPSVRPIYTGPTSLNVNSSPNGVNNFATLADAFAKLNGKFLPTRIVISMAKDTYENASLEMISGETVVILANDHTISGSLKMQNVSNRVYIYNLKITTPVGSHCINADTCRFVVIENCTLNADSYNNGHYNACINAKNTSATIGNTAMWHSYSAVIADSNAQVYMTACKGNYNTYAVCSQLNSTVGIAKSRPSGDTGVYCAGDSAVRGATGAYDAGEGVVVPSTPPATTSATLNATNTRTYGNGWINSTNALAQGVRNSVTYYGCMWFDTSSISGKTIKSATLRLYRRAGAGNGSPVNVYIGSHNAASPSGAINIVSNFSNYLVGSVDQNQTLSAAIPVEAVQQLVNGTAKGLFIHSTSSGYAQFDGFDAGTPPQLTVTYQ